MYSLGGLDNLRKGAIVPKSAITNKQRKILKKQKQLEKSEARRKETAKRQAAALKVSKKTAKAKAKASGNGKEQIAPIPKASPMTGVKVGNAYYFHCDVVEVNADQPRFGKDYDYIREVLTPGIKQSGQHTPGKVCIIHGARGKVKFKLVGGEHRYWACERLGIPFWAVVVYVKDAKDLFLQSFEDNEGIKQYTDQEKATAIVRMRDEYNMTWEDICERMGGAAHITAKTFYHLGKMPLEVQEMVKAKVLPKAVITELAAVPKAHIVATAKKVQGMAATDAYHEVRRAQEAHGGKQNIGGSSTRKRRIGDDLRLYLGSLKTALGRLQRMNDLFTAEQLKEMLASNISLDANLLLMLHLDRVITNAIHAQKTALANLPPKFKLKALEGMALSARAKLDAVILAPGSLPNPDVDKLKAIRKKVK